MVPSKAKERFEKHFTPYLKYWYRLILPSAVFFALTTHFTINREISWEFISDRSFYSTFIWYLILTTISNYYVFYRPNLRYHQSAGKNSN
ncbi:hypothetical protein LV83_00165 [Algoriphagus yeomjeoni]|uniref:Uncharacterized protein n=1 Tax=Algoriphagus yeomjeoni TaxID=291403 RepID=A0A327PRY1_9BACT|nr:hypothetical protein LV83_00165 [Algoriphagus yeomjeoni]